MNLSFFSFEGNILSYTCFGHGSKIILAFHGFGQYKEVFRNFDIYLGKTYTIYSFDLFMHGGSKWNDKTVKMDKNNWSEMIGGFLKKNNITRFSLLAFSMGGKFALTILETFFEKIDTIILIAPDGIKTNFWYNLATMPGWMEGIFKSVVINPKKIQSLSRIFRALRLADKGVVRFAEGQLKTREQRLRVYYAWIVFSKLKFDITDIASIINTHKIEFYIFLGKYDKVITQKNMQKLISLLDRPNVMVLESGHNLLIESAGKWIKENQPDL